MEVLDRRVLVGKIILAKVLEGTPEEFSTFLHRVLKHPVFERMVEQGLLQIRYLAPWEPCPSEPPEVVVRLLSGGGFLYLHRESALVFELKEQLCPLSQGMDPEGVRLLLHRLRRINTRNLLLYEVVKGLREVQKRYFEAATPEEALWGLKPLSLRQFCKGISQGRDLPFVVDPSRVSRLIRSLSVKDPFDKRVPLRAFLPSKRDLLRLWIKELLKVEKTSGKGPYSDRHLAQRIGALASLRVSDREIALVRAELGIPPSDRRNGYEHLALSLAFSALYPFCSPSVRSEVPPRPGVYELSLKDSYLEYPRGWSRTLYIGSSSNLRRRLIQHLKRRDDHILTEYLSRHALLFRFLEVPEGWVEKERKLLEAFVESYGAAPFCNSVIPKGGKGKGPKR